MQTDRICGRLEEPEKVPSGTAVGKCIATPHQAEEGTLRSHFCLYFFQSKLKPQVIARDDEQIQYGLWQAILVQEYKHAKLDTEEGSIFFCSPGLFWCNLTFLNKHGLKPEPETLRSEITSPYFKNCLPHLGRQLLLKNKPEKNFANKDHFFTIFKSALILMPLQSHSKNLEERPPKTIIIIIIKNSKGWFVTFQKIRSNVFWTHS